MPQLQHNNMWVVAARSAVLSVITGGGKWVEITTHADPLYQHLIVTAERKFWRCVESGEPPRLFGVEPPKPRIEAVRIVDMSASNSWSEFAGLFRSTRRAFLDHERSESELKALMHGRPWCPGQTIKVWCSELRSPRGGGAQSCSALVRVSARSRGQSPGSVGQSGKIPDHDHTTRYDRRSRTVLPLRPAVERARYRAQDFKSARDCDSTDHFY